MRANIRAILTDCIERGLRDGYRRAHKHVDNPTEHGLTSSIEDAIWLYIDEYFTFEDNESR